MPTSPADQLIGIVESTFQNVRFLTETEASIKPAPDKWSKKQILGHLFDSALNNHQRFIRSQEATELSFPGYEQEFWVEAQCYQECSWIELLQLWGHYNLHLARVIRRIPEDKLDNFCKIGGNAPVSLGFLVEDYLEHLKHHLRQIESI
jgi:hypothetical protein